MTSIDHNLLQLANFPYPQQHPVLQNAQNAQDAFNTASILDECCTLNHDINDFCCATVEPSPCCGPHGQISIDSLDCCSRPHAPMAINGYNAAEVECCTIETTSKETEADCCQDVSPALAAPPSPTCCAKHPEVINDCCLTCCPDTLTASPGSSATRSTSSSTLSATPTPSSIPTAHYFQSQPLTYNNSIGNNEWNAVDMCNQLDHSHSHSANSAFHFLGDSMIGGTDMHGSDSMSGTPSVASMPLSPEQMSEAQIDHMIRCLWSGCSAEFLSQEDLLPHVSQLHVPNPDINHPLCLWESCETEQLDTDNLLQHLQAEHHITPVENLNLPSTSHSHSAGTHLQAFAPVHTPSHAQTHSHGQAHAKTHSHAPEHTQPHTHSQSQKHTQPPTPAQPHSFAESNTKVVAESSTAPTAVTPTDSNAKAGETHQCRWKGCNRLFPNFDSLTSHLSEDHVSTGKSKYVCEWEGCERNGRIFSQRQKAMRHIQTHTGDKPYQCQRCRKRFSEANIMAQHMRTHTGEKPFKCPEPGCNREFSIAGALTIHLRVHTGEKPFKCKFEGCDKWFSESSNLTKHLRVHTGERPFQCDFPGCLKRFSRPDQVSRHKRIHLSAEEKAAQSIKSKKRDPSPRFDPL